MRLLFCLLLTLPSFAQNKNNPDLVIYLSAYYEEIRSAVQEHKDNLVELQMQSAQLQKCQKDQNSCLSALDEVVRTSVYYYFNTIDLEAHLEDRTRDDAERSQVRMLKSKLDQVTQNSSVVARASECRIRIRESNTDEINLKIYFASRCAYGLSLEGNLVTAAHLNEFLDTAIQDFSQTLERLEEFRINNPNVIRMNPEVIQVLREAYRGKD